MLLVSVFGILIGTAFLFIKEPRRLRALISRRVTGNNERASAMRYVDLSHLLEDGMKTSPGLPNPKIGALLDHKGSRFRHSGKAEFYLGKVEMACNSGAYLNSPFRRYPDRPDLSQISLETVAGLPRMVSDGRVMPNRSVTIKCGKEEIHGRGVLIRTGWDQRWGADGYWELGPYLSDESLQMLIHSKAKLVGVDFSNVDDTVDSSRPVHTRLLASDSTLFHQES